MRISMCVFTIMIRNKVELPSGIENKVNFRLMDINGREVNVPFVQQQNVIHIETAEFSNGIYFLNVEHEENSANFKVVKL